jgi:RimJ/RimL family protein N-acetyltransferase
VRLRDVIDADLDALFAHQADPVAYELADVRTRDREAFNAHWARIRNDPDVLIRTIDLNGAVAGHVLSFMLGGQRVIGYWLGREFWGRGIATEAVEQLLQIETRRPLHAHVSPPNRGSARVLEKNGFRLLREEPDSLIFELP